tara:strand:- start:1935 stop:2441 length:507 start_codon:yes stop_codon:yes gene_type:complete
LADGRGCADVHIVAISLVGSENTSCITAGVVGAWVSIITRDKGSRATFARLAGIVDRACFAIRACIIVRFVLTALFLITAIIGARIVIEADDGITHARSCFAMISLSACISIQAFTLLERHVGATSVTAAAIFCTWVAVVACVVVDESITVIVDPITEFFCGRSCVTR